MKTLEYAARQTVRTCLDIRPEENVTIIYDIAASDIAESIINEISLIPSVNYKSFLMETYGERPENGENSLQFPDEIRKSLKKSDVSLFVAGETKPGEYLSFRHPMNETVSANGLRHAHIPGITEEAFVSGMSVDYNHISDLTEKIYGIVENSEKIKVTTPRGSNFTAEVGKYDWVICDGFPTVETWKNLPDGEIFTTPLNLNGRVVVDGVLGDYFDQKYGLLDETPLVIGFENSRITRIYCPKNKELEEEFREYISKDENASRVGEFAIGTNIGLEGLLGNMLHDEKFPGIHIAIGDPLGEDTGAEWESDVHCDMVMKDCNIEVDGNLIMLRGEFSKRLIGY